MKIIEIEIKSLQDVKHLVQIAEKCVYDVDLLWGRYVVDAKSMLGVFSLPQFEKAELHLHSENCDDVVEKLREFGLTSE